MVKFILVWIALMVYVIIGIYNTASAMPYYYAVGKNISTDAWSMEQHPYTKIITNTVRPFANPNDDLILVSTIVYIDGKIDESHSIGKNVDVFYKFIYNEDINERRMFYKKEGVKDWIELKNEHRYTDMYTCIGEVTFQIYFNEEFFGNDVLYPYGHDHVGL